MTAVEVAASAQLFCEPPNPWTQKIARSFRVGGGGGSVGGGSSGGPGGRTKPPNVGGLVFTVLIKVPVAHSTVWAIAPIEKNRIMNRTFEGTRYMHYIAKPNKKGIACGVVQRGVPLPSPVGGIPFYPNYRLGPLDGTICDSLGLKNEPLADFWWFADSTLSVEFADNSSYEPAQWHWDFGDGGTSQDTSPVHLFPAPGSYDVCLIVSNQYAADTVCKAVTVGLSAGTEPEKADPEHFVRVFPNPADDFFQIVYHLQGGPKQFHLFDATGRLLRSRVLENGAGNVIFNIGMLPSGLYWYTLQGRNCTYSGRLVKQ